MWWATLQFPLSEMDLQLSYLGVLVWLHSEFSGFKRATASTGIRCHQTNGERWFSYSLPIDLGCNSNVDSVVTLTSIHPNVSAPLHFLWKPLLCSFLCCSLFCWGLGLLKHSDLKPERFCIHLPSLRCPFHDRSQTADNYNHCSSPVFPIEWDTGKSPIYTHGYASYLINSH